MAETMTQVAFTDEEKKFLSVLYFEDFNDDYFSKADGFYSIDVSRDEYGYNIKLWLSDNSKVPHLTHEFPDFETFSVVLKRLVREWENKE
jgi:hypothetical protein